MSRGADPGPTGPVPERPVPDPEPVDRSPTLLSAAIAVAAAVLAVGIVGAALEPAGWLGSPGVALVAFGLYRGERRWVDYGVVAVVVAIVVTGAAGAGPRVTAPAALCAVLAWDAGGYAITLGRELGRGADTARAELVHAGLTVGVGAAGLALAGAAFLVATGDPPALAVTALFAGAVALLLAVREGSGDGDVPM